MVFDMKGRKVGFRTDNEIRKFENTRNEIVKSIYSRGGKVKMGDIVKDNERGRYFSDN